MSTTARWARQLGIGPKAYAAMRRGLLLFVAITAAGAGFDLLTKWWAVQRLPSLGLVPLTERLGLQLVYNHGTAGGYSIGEHTLLFNIVVMSTVLLLVVAMNVMCSGIDARSPVAFGLIAGGGTGNLASVVGGPSGVPDFLAWHLPDGMVVFNVADVVLWLGCALLIPLGWRLALQLRGGPRDLRHVLAA
jgi:lipoprotein signal peptidase